MSSDVAIPPVFRQNVVGNWGDDGRRWLVELPSRVAAIARDWELTVGDPYPLSFNWVAPARRADGSAAVLKLGVPSSGHLADEANALEAYAGQGAVRLLARDDDRGVLLLERATPGSPASDLVPHLPGRLGGTLRASDEAATAAFVKVTRRLHRPPPLGCPLPELADRGGSFVAHLRAYPDDRVLPRRLVERASRLFDELVASATDRVVLHGDLHHDNILRADREPWLAIDPHGAVGDPGAEVGPLFCNPDPSRRDDNLVALVPARVEQVADGLGLPIDRVVAWGFVLCVLSEVWDVEGGATTTGRALDVALTLLPRLP
ncbi:aminoglycoside phosphotransferase family protein [Micromonospora sp. NPDC050397]|uniref:aminoglycoside phosphotransferase family protein n=1 Tax=Micromonospora sp. NPDC050397 TaxID=3364279 RepID=UPI00384BB956